GSAARMGLVVAPAPAAKHRRLLPRLDEGRSAEPVGSGEWHARPQQRDLEVLRHCPGTHSETGGQDREAPSDAPVPPPCVRWKASLSGNRLRRKVARRDRRTRARRSASGGFGPPSRRCRYLLMRALCHVICRLHDALPQLFCLISKDLGLPTDELTLQLSEFLRFPHANHPLGEIERVHERFFRKEQGAVANTSRLLIHAFRRRPGDREQTLESGLALAEILLGDIAHPVH